MVKTQMSGLPNHRTLFLGRKICSKSEHMSKQVQTEYFTRVNIKYFIGMQGTMLEKVYCALGDGGREMCSVD